MKLQPLVCPHCGAVLNITASTKVVHCEFSDSDIMIEQDAPQIQQMNRNVPPPEFVVHNEMPLRQFPNMPVNALFDNMAFQKWRKKFRNWQTVLAICTIVFVLMVTRNSASNIALIPFLGGIEIFTIAPILLAARKPDKANPAKNRKGWNVFKYYMLSVLNVVVSFLAAAIIAGIMGFV